MKKLLKINGTPVLNFVDLQKTFSPTAIYEQLEIFDSFAAVHCVPLPVLLTDRESGNRYIARYLTKEFWHKILRSVQWPQAAGDIDACLDFFLRQEIEEQSKGEDNSGIKEAVDREMEDAELHQKLCFIAQSAQVGEDYRKAVLLLVISELAEKDARKVEAGGWKKPDSTGQDSQEQVSGDAHTAAIPFTYEETAYLTAGSQVYRYWYHDRDVLSPGEKIRTVRIEAKGSSNQYADVRIELYNEETGQCVQKIVLQKGEYRYCNVAGGRVIKFLPAVSLSDDICLSRSDYGKSEIMVFPKNGESWILNAENVTCFSAGSKEKGFLLIKDGKVNFQFYKEAEDYFTRLQLEIIAMPVVEALVSRQGYELLLEDGSTVTNTEKGVRKDVLTLNDTGRYPLPAVTDLSDCREAVFSETRESLAILRSGKEKESIYFAGGNRKFRVQETEIGIEIACDKGGEMKPTKRIGRLISDLGRRHASERTEPVKTDTVRQADINKVVRMREKIEAILSFETKGELSGSLRAGFESWRTLQSLKEESEAAEVVLSAYYRQGKIRDFLSKIQVFTNRIETLSSADAAREMGYNNYIFFLRDQVSEMKEKYRRRQSEISGEPIQNSVDNVVWFIQTECCAATSVKELPGAYETASRLLETMQCGREKTRQDRKDIAAVSGAIELFENGDKSELERLSDGFEQRKKAIHASINEGTALYEALVSVMTEEWFDAFDPELENNPIAAMSAGELKAFYLEKLNELNGKLPQINNR